MQIASVAVCITLSASLCACGNAFESLDVGGEWQQVGSAAAPEVGGGDKTTTEEISAGTGSTVRPGDLVRVRINAIRVNLPQRSAGHAKDAESFITWLWAGREPWNRDHAALNSWGDLGSPRLRAALIGKPVGSKLVFTPGPNWTEPLPLRGFGTAFEHFTLRDNGTLEKPPLWPMVYLDNRQRWIDPQARGVEIEILQACEARLFSRTATMRQRGYIFNMFEMSYQSEREGTLRWSALEANCPQPPGRIRFEIGPLYYVSGRPPKMLYNWSDSYRRLRPAKQFPNEYVVCTLQSTGGMRCPGL